MTNTLTLARGVPPDYYRRIYHSEEQHWWYAGMHGISAVLLGARLEQPGQRVLDAGCGTGGSLRWLLDRGAVASAAGVDVAPAAIELARQRVPEAELHVAALRELPFGDGSFDLVLCNDVLQHVPGREVGASLGELRRVLASGGALLLRTNGARRLRRERDDWRAYDSSSLVDELERAGFACERVTHANMLLSLVAAVRGRPPRAPSEERHGIPTGPSSRWRSAVGARVLAAEARWLTRPGRSLPYGHTLFALAVPAPS